MIEYGIHISAIRELPSDPRSLCSDQWRGLLPPAPLLAVYFGSEFCEELLPDVDTVERFCRWARESDVEAVLLTPVVTPRGLASIERLLLDLAGRDCTPAIVCNDWGVLNLLLRSSPGFSRRAGRLMNRGLRDPRLPEKPGIRENRIRERMRRMRSLLMRFGVEALETDPDLEGSYLGERVAGLQRTLHFPYAFAATGRNCLVKADAAASAEECFTKGLGIPCAGVCRGRSHRIQREDTGTVLWRSGNTIFYEVSPLLAEAHLAQADRIVLHERPAA